MKENTNHAILLWAGLLVVTAVLSVVLPFVHSTVFWIAAVCDLLMFIGVECVFVRAFRRGGSLESKLLGWPIFRTGFVTLTVQVIIGFALMALAGICHV